MAVKGEEEVSQLELEDLMTGVSGNANSNRIYIGEETFSWCFGCKCMFEHDLNVKATMICDLFYSSSH